MVFECIFRLSSRQFTFFLIGVLIIVSTTIPVHAYSSTFTDSTGGWHQTVSYSSQKTTSLSHSISFGDVISITGNNHPVSRIRYFSGACTGMYCGGSVIHTVYPGTNNYAIPYYEGAKGIVIDANAYVYFTSGSGLVNPNPPPETDFSANLTTGTAPLAVQFNDSSSNDPDSFFWQFGNGLDSAEKDPVIVYADSGTYTVRHSATNDGGTTWKNVTGYISVQNAPPPQNIPYYAEYWNLPDDFELLTYPGGHAGLVADCAGLGGTASSGYQRVYVYSHAGQVLNYYVSDTNGVIKGPGGEYPWHNIAVGFSPNGSAVAYDMCMNGSYPKIAYHPGNPPIVVTFNATPTTGSAPLTVQFNDTSTGAPTSWTWDFGDGTNSTMQHPLHTYDAAGNYTILHSATNALGIRWKNITDYITVTDPAPVANFTATPTSGPAPLTVTFTDTSTGAPTNWSWDFSDGNSSTEQNPSHTYEAAGTYDVSLTAANMIGSDTMVREGLIIVTIPPPVADFSGSPLSGDAPLDVQFTDLSTGSPTTWSWDFGDDSYSTDQSPLHTYSAAGTYDVSLTVDNTGGSDTEEMVGYVTVTEEQVSNQATNIQGINESESSFDSIIDVAAIDQTVLNYNPTKIYFTEGDIRNKIQSRLPDDTIFFSHSHGQPGLIEVNQDENEIYYAKGGTPGYNFDDNPSYNNLRLAVFLGCHTGETAEGITGANLVSVIINKGGGCAIGWTDAIVDYGEHAYGPVFWNEIKNGIPILSAHYQGVEAAQNEYWCQYLGQIDPEQYGDDCNLGKIYSADNNQQCSLPLPEGIINQLKNNNNLQTTKEITISETNSGTKNKEIITAISQFLEKPVSSSDSEKIIHYPYGDIHQVKSEKSSFGVNSVTGRVQSAIIYESGSKDQPEIIDLEQGSAIAEAYAKDKYPELWNVSNKKSVKQTIKQTNDQGINRNFKYIWQEIINKTDSESNLKNEIKGMNSVSITVSPYTGDVINYHEWYMSYDPALVLTPTITEDEGWQIAESHFRSTEGNGVSVQKTALGLSVGIDQNNHQHLIWNYKITKKNEWDLEKSNIFGIDAKDGDIVWQTSID